ncbi:MAG TPA: hypothetical protein VGZ25_15150 [Gemmataceae bacterium]|jgi:hypothetical protein|nr:hypothetical protein [Gemmataceae bacterium]
MNESDNIGHFHNLLAQRGELYQIKRDGCVSTHQGLKNHDTEGGFYIGFLPEVAIMPNDELKGVVSQHVYRVIEVKSEALEGIPYQTKAYYKKQGIDQRGD